MFSLQTAHLRGETARRLTEIYNLALGLGYRPARSRQEAADNLLSGLQDTLPELEGRPSPWCESPAENDNQPLAGAPDIEFSVENGGVISYAVTAHGPVRDTVIVLHSPDEKGADSGHIWMIHEFGPPQAPFWVDVRYIFNPYPLSKVQIDRAIPPGIYYDKLFTDLNLIRDDLTEMRRGIEGASAGSKERG